MAKHLAVQKVAGGIKLARFTHADVWLDLEDREDVTESDLFKEFQAAVLADLGSGQWLVLNLERLSAFPPSLVRFLEHIQRRVRDRRADLVLCHARRAVRDVLGISQATSSLLVVETEADAIRAAGARNQPL